MAVQTVVPFFRVPSGAVTEACREAIERVVSSNWFILGPEVEAFESEFADFCGVKQCVGLGSGTDALELALRALGIGRGDRVVVVANAGYYGSIAVRVVEALPTYVDIDERTMTMSADALVSALELGPKAIIVTHLYGQLANVEPIAALARKAGVPLIEDCAQAHGAERGGRKAGAFGTIGCFSFYPTKNLGALGDGGAIVTDDPDLADRVRRLRQYGWDRKYDVTLDGGRNSRLDEMQAAVLRARLPYLAEWSAQRRHIARQYNEAFQQLPLLCPEIAGDEYVGHLFVIRSRDRDAIRRHLAERGIASDIHYPIADHLQAVCRGETAQNLPLTERACASVLSLPCFPGLREDEVEVVSEAVRSYFASQG